MTATSTASNWRDVLERSFGEIRASIDSELAQTRDSARAEGGRATAEALNLALRRLRQAAQVSDTLNILVEVAAPFSSRSALISLDGTRARSSLIRGFVAPEISFEVGTAAAVMAAIETRDPVVAAGSESELSPELFNAAVRELETTERCYLFPLVSAGSVRAILLAVVGVQSAPLELLAEAAALRLELLELSNRASPKSAQAWTDLHPHDQAIHLKAQRFARVKVAEIRLARAAAVREGQERGALYKTLRPEIDSARQQFRTEFLATTPTMVDYLYIELVRSLANDDDRLLGPDFPGRLI